MKRLFSLPSLLAIVVPWPAVVRAAAPFNVADVARTVEEIALISIHPQVLDELDEHDDTTEAERKKERFGYR